MDNVCFIEVNSTRAFALMKQIMLDENAMNFFMFSSNSDLNTFLIFLDFCAGIITNSSQAP